MTDWLPLGKDKYALVNITFWLYAEDMEDGDGFELRRKLLQVSQDDLDLSLVFTRDFGKITAEGFNLAHNGFNSLVDSSCQLLGILSKPFNVVENPCQPLFTLDATK